MKAVSQLIKQQSLQSTPMSFSIVMSYIYQFDPVNCPKRLWRTLLAVKAKSVPALYSTVVTVFLSCYKFQCSLDFTLRARFDFTLILTTTGLWSESASAPMTSFCIDDTVPKTTFNEYKVSDICHYFILLTRVILFWFQIVKQGFLACSSRQKVQC